jgi:hypothetical protein
MTVKTQTLRQASSSKLWQLIALAVVELAQREDDPTTSPRVEIRRINGGKPQATITVALENSHLSVPPLLCIGNATLDKKRRHHFEAFPVDAATVSRINRAAYREFSAVVL